MAFIATAIIGAGALGAGASIFGANRAANAQTNAANASIAAQQGMFNTSKEQLQPFIDAGKGGIPQLQSFLDRSDPSSPLAQLLRLTMPGSDQSAALAETPGYQFSLAQGEKAVRSGMAARGLGGPGGPLAKGASSFAEGLAGTQWQNIVNALQNSFSSGSGALQNLVGTGAGSASSLAGNATATGQGIGSALIGAGNAQGGAATATGNAVGSFANSIPNAVLLQRLLGQRLLGQQGNVGGGGNGGLYSTVEGF